MPSAWPAWQAVAGPDHCLEVTFSDRLPPSFWRASIVAYNLVQPGAGRDRRSIALQPHRAGPCRRRRARAGPRTDQRRSQGPLRAAQAVAGLRGAADARCRHYRGPHPDGARRAADDQLSAPRTRGLGHRDRRYRHAAAAARWRPPAAAHRARRRESLPWRVLRAPRQRAGTAVGSGGPDHRLPEHGFHQRLFRAGDRPAGCRPASGNSAFAHGPAFGGCRRLRVRAVGAQHRRLGAQAAGRCGGGEQLGLGRCAPDAARVPARLPRHP